MWYDSVSIIYLEVKVFKYQDATHEELVEHVLKSTRQCITAAVNYYKIAGNKQMVVKIKDARKIAIKIRLQAKLENME